MRHRTSDTLRLAALVHLLEHCNDIFELVLRSDSVLFTFYLTLEMPMVVLDMSVLYDTSWSWKTRAMHPLPFQNWA